MLEYRNAFYLQCTLQVYISDQCSDGDMMMMAGGGLPETVGVLQQLGGGHGGGVQVARHQGDQHRVWKQVSPQR